MTRMDNSDYKKPSDERAQTKVARSSQRIKQRNLSGKIGKHDLVNRNPDFVYEGYPEVYSDSETVKENSVIRSRSGSWSSNCAAVAVVELTKKRRKKHKLSPPAKASTIFTKGSEKTQTQLSQQRIDTWFDRQSEVGAKEDNTNRFKVIPYEDFLCNHNQVLKRIHTQTAGIVNQQEKEDQNNTTADSAHINRGNMPEGDSTLLPPQQQLEEEVEANTVESTEQKRAQNLKDMIDNVQKDLKDEMKKMFAELKMDIRRDLGLEVSEGDTEKSDKKSIGEDIRQACSDASICKIQLSDAIDVVIKQDQVITECKNRIEDLQLQLDADTLRIQGIEEQ